MIRCGEICEDLPTWKRRPSGEKMVMCRSYPAPLPRLIVSVRVSLDLRFVAFFDLRNRLNRNDRSIYLYRARCWLCLQDKSVWNSDGYLQTRKLSKVPFWCLFGLAFERSFEDNEWKEGYINETGLVQFYTSKSRTKPSKLLKYGSISVWNYSSLENWAIIPISYLKFLKLHR